MSVDASHDSVLEFAAQIVSAHVSNNSVQASALPDLIQQVYKALTMVGSEPAPADKLEPAVPLKKSVFPDYIVCLEDGKKLKMLKRHLMTSYGMTPEAYRERWGLPSNYPMVAPSYAERRSALAKPIGLGRKPAGGGSDAVGEEGGEAPAKAAKRGRKPARPAGDAAE